MKENIMIFYQLNLDVYEKVKKRDYHHFSKSEIVENMLWGNVIILNNDNTLFSFEADLFKFFIVFFDELKKISLGEELESKIYSIYDDYYFYLKLHEKNKVKISFNKQKESLFNIKNLSYNVKEIKLRLFKDFKILYPDYLKLKEFDYLANKIG
jgi:hypothetical protein